MKNAVKKILKSAFVLLLAAGLLAASSCGGKKASDYVIYATDDSGKVITGMTEGMFSFFLSQQKANYLAVLMYNDNTITSDTPEAWDKLSATGESYGEKFYDTIIEEAKNIVAANYILYTSPSASNPDKNYTLPEDYVDYVTALVKQNAIQNYGSVMNFESYLLNYGTTLDDYTELYLMTANVDLLKEAMFSDEGGWYEIDNKTKMEYFLRNYYSVDHVFINTAYDEKIDGTRAPLSDAETKKREELAGEILTEMKSGASMEKLDENYSQSYVEVYTETSSMDINSSTSVRELGEALKTMSVGEVRSVESDYGIHVIKRVETSEEDFESAESISTSITNVLANELYPERVKELSEGNITVNSEKTGEYDIRTAIMP